MCRIKVRRGGSCFILNHTVGLSSTLLSALTGSGSGRFQTGNIPSPARRCSSCKVLPLSWDPPPANIGGSSDLLNMLKRARGHIQCYSSAVTTDLNEHSSFLYLAMHPQNQLQRVGGPSRAYLGCVQGGEQREDPLHQQNYMC